MDQENENLYETRTNLFSSENVIDYLWRRCEKTIYPFKPDNAFGIEAKELTKDYVKGKEIISDFVLSSSDIKNADIRKGQEYNFEISQFYTYNVEKNIVSDGKLALVYKSDRKYYSLFELVEKTGGEKELHLIMKVKQKVGLFGSFQTEMVCYY